MEKSFKFKYIEDNLVKLFNLIYYNENISKYIYYLNDTPLSSPTVPVDLLDEGYYLFSFFDGNVPEEDKVRVFINPVSGLFNKQPLSEIIYSIEVVIPNKYSLLHGAGKFRAFRIFDEIAQMVDQQRVAGVTEPEITKFRSSGIFKTEYSYFAIEIKINSSSVKGLR